MRSLIEATDEERELVHRMKAGEELAFEEFAEHYIPAIYRFAAARLKGERELVREIVQSTVCKVIEKLNSYRGEAPLFLWICACCRNEIAAHFRRTIRRNELGDFDFDAEPAIAGEEANPEQQLLVHERENLVHATLDHLPPRYARALEWKYLEGLSVDEISRRFEVSPKAAESLLTRARRAFEAIHARLAETKR